MEDLFFIEIANEIMCRIASKDALSKNKPGKEVEPQLPGFIFVHPEKEIVHYTYIPYIFLGHASLYMSERGSLAMYVGLSDFFF